MDILTQNDIFGEYPKSYYADTVDFLPSFSRLSENLTCDICVVGGGYTGLSTALSLSEKGYSVVLLEAQRVAFGASGRNGGQVCSGQRWSVTDLKKTFGIENSSATFCPDSFDLLQTETTSTPSIFGIFISHITRS